MKIGKAVKSTLGNDEVVKKAFSYGKRHIYVRLTISLLKWLLIAIAAGTLIVVIYQVSDAAARGVVVPLLYHGDEGVKQIGSELWQGFLMRASIISLVIFLFLFSPFLMFYHLFYIHTSNLFVLTDRRIIVKRGWLNTTIKSVNYDRITDVAVEQSFLDKVLYDTGTLFISTAGGDGYELELNCISRPHEMKKDLSDLKEEYRRRTYPAPASE